MGWRIVKQPNGFLARFSDVVDDFTHYDMTEEEAIEYCREHMGRLDAIAKVQRGVNDEPVPGFVERTRDDGLDRFRDCINTIHLVHGERVARERERQLSGDAGVTCKGYGHARPPEGKPVIPPPPPKESE